MQIYEEIIQTLKNRGVKQSVTKTTAFRDLGLDSLDLMDMVVRLEEKIGFQIPDPELIKIKTVGDLIAAVEKLQK